MQGADVGVMPQFCNMAVQWIHRQTRGGGGGTGVLLGFKGGSAELPTRWDGDRVEGVYLALRKVI